MSADVFNAFTDAQTKTNIAAICFVLAQLFFFLTILSAFVNMTVAIMNLVIYGSLVTVSASLCVSELMEKKKIE